MFNSRPRTWLSMHINEQNFSYGDGTPGPSARTTLLSKRVKREGRTQPETRPLCKIKAESVKQVDRKEILPKNSQRPVPHRRACGSGTEFGVSCRGAGACREHSTIINFAEDEQPANRLDRGRSQPILQNPAPTLAQISPKRTYSITKTENESCSDDASISSLASPKRQKLTTKKAQAFACPFYKHDPIRYNPQNSDSQLARRFRTCSGPGWDSTHRLKEHLRRAHETELEQPSLQIRQQLKRKSRGSTERDQWMAIYMMLFPQTKDLPSPYYLEPAVTPDVAAQSLAYYLYNELPDRMLREISKSEDGLSPLSFREEEPSKLVSHVVRKSLYSAYKDWLRRQDWPTYNASTASTDMHIDDGDRMSHSTQSDIQESPPEPSGEAGKYYATQGLSGLGDPERPMSTTSTISRVEFFLSQTRLCADWHLQQYQQIPSTEKFVESTPVNLAHRQTETRDDQGLWYKFYLAVVMLKRKESLVGWKLAKEGCESTRDILEHSSTNFFPNLYNHFGSHKWDEFESLRLHILQYLTEMSAVLLGTNHPLTIILRHLAIEGFLETVSGLALKIMLDIYEQSLGFMHPDVIQTERSLCKVFRRQNEFSRATDRVKTMLKHSEQVKGRYDANTRRCMRRLGHLYRYQEQYDEAEKMYQDVVQVAEDSSVSRGDLDDLALCTVHDLVSITFQARQFERAESWARLAMTAAVDGRNITPENRLVCVLDLHKCLEAQGRTAEARDWKDQYSHISCVPLQESCEEHALLSSISKDHFAWVLAESGHPYLLPDAY